MVARVFAVLVASSLVAVFGPAGVASAQAFTYASACLRGEEGPGGLVASSNGPSFFSNVQLFCGDPTKGVLHINDEHPIRDDGADDENIVKCHNKIMGSGEEVPANAGNRAWQISNGAGGTATIVFDANTLETITMFTSDSNNWAACAAF